MKKSQEFLEKGVEQERKIHPNSLKNLTYRFPKGNIPWNKGKKHSEETREKISNALKGKEPWNKGIPCSEETKRKISEALKGRKLPKEIKEKISSALRGKFEGQHHSPETEFKEGPEHPNWKGGVSKDKKHLRRIHRIWCEKNKEHVRRQKRKYQRERRRNNPQVRIEDSMSGAIYRALRDRKNGRSWEKLVGYTLDDLVEHLESQFTDEMSWDNYGDYWEIDHIKPKSLFDYENPEDEEFKKCWALENLQPLEVSENRKKYINYDEGV